MLFNFVRLCLNIYQFLTVEQNTGLTDHIEFVAAPSIAVVDIKSKEVCFSLCKVLHYITNIES